MGTVEFLVYIYCLANDNSWSTFHKSTSVLKNLSAHTNTAYFLVYDNFEGLCCQTKNIVITHFVVMHHWGPS